MVYEIERLANKFDQNGLRNAAERTRQFSQQLKKEGLIPEALETDVFKEDLEHGRVFEHHKFLFYPDRSIVIVNGIEEERNLTPKLNQLLQTFVLRPNIIHSESQLMKNVWGSEQYSRKIITTAIKRLRSILESDPHKPEIIINVFGHGYYLKHGNRSSLE